MKWRDDMWHGNQHCLLASKQLHSEQCEYDDEKKREKKQWNDRLHAVEKWNNQISHGHPVSAQQSVKKKRIRSSFTNVG